MHACRAVEAAAESASDVVGRAFWWSNCIQLRWMLWAMSHGGSLDSEYGQELGGSVDDFDWVMQVWLWTSYRHLTGSMAPTPVAAAARVIQASSNCFISDALVLENELPRPKESSLHASWQSESRCIHTRQRS